VVAVRPPTADDLQDVRGRLASLGFPFGDHAAQVAWCNARVNDGALERHTLTEKLMSGMEIPDIAATAGIEPIRVYHHLGRPAGFVTAEHNPWRIVLDLDDE
jgi:hypothetical protein